MIPGFVNLDIEVTNRCNADCYFCPRDQTPHQGLMSAETFDQTLRRAVELREMLTDRTDMGMKVSLCGLGEPLLNPKTIGFIGQVRDAGFSCNMASNGSLLSEEKGRRILDAGLTEIDINVGEEGEEYERIYGLSFEKTRSNVVRFAEMAEGRCEVRIVLVDHREDEGHRKHMLEYWKGQGLDNFFAFPLINRGGALAVERMRYDEPHMIQRARMLVEDEVDTPLCMFPFVFLFVGYDGHYYLCCADWKKEASYGTVFDKSFHEILGPKLASTRTREVVCHSCSLDPTNILIDTLKAHDAGTVSSAALAAKASTAIEDTRAINGLIDALHPGLVEDPAFEGRAARRTIPLLNG